MKKYSNISRLLLVNIVIAILFCVPTPFFANIFNPLGLLDIATILISIVILVKGIKDTHIKKSSSIFMILGSVINFLAIFYDIYMSMQFTGDLASIAIGFPLLVLQCISMSARILGIIMACIEYKAVKRYA
ncbi:hypothetical protein R4Y45_04345 [Holzapfeliella sp. He02]|uniref:Uncharacterized protein n=1 Tax=Holzapfeliella saturejae TaxID=3082953 RepID=A0ABU8SGE4_9LACO